MITGPEVKLGSQRNVVKHTPETLCGSKKNVQSMNISCDSKLLSKRSVKVNFISIIRQQEPEFFDVKSN